MRKQVPGTRTMTALAATFAVLSVLPAIGVTACDPPPARTVLSPKLPPALPPRSSPTFSPTRDSDVPKVKNAQWTGTWAASPQRPERRAGFRDVTLRLIVRTTIGGSAARIRLSNEFGPVPLRIGAATVGIAARGAAVRRGTLRELTFDGGWTGTTVAPGAQVISDGVPERVPAGTDLAVSLYLPAYTGPATEHADRGRSHQTSYVSLAGNHASAPGPSSYPRTRTTDQWFYLDGVDVDAPGTSAVVTLGDSITDGTASTNDTDHRYPDWLADRLRAAGGPYAKLSVLNEGLGGNELLHTSACCGASPSALARLGTDVLGQSGVKDVIVLLGTNDLYRRHHATAPQVIAGLKELIARLHAAHLRVFGGTIPPSSLFSPAEEQVREAVNRWIAASGAFDGVEDFARAVADPSDPRRLAPRFDSGGHLHPNDAGYRAMASAVNLPALLTGHPE